MNEPDPPKRRRPIRHAPIVLDDASPLDAKRARIDRLKLSIPAVGVSPTLSPEVFVGHLKASRARFEKPISAGGKGRKAFLEFKDTHWHFGFKASFAFTDGVWSGGARLELNAIRLLAAIIEKRDFLKDPRVHPHELVRDGRGPSSQTLDESDNFIPAARQGWANAIQWPTFCQSYVEAVVQLLGYGLGEVASPKRSTITFPLALLPPLKQWVFREVEVCFEFFDADALSRIDQISKIALGLARDHKDTRYAGKHGRLQENGKRLDMRSVRLGVGAKGVEIAVYAEALDRVRLEVRYKTEILKRCNLKQATYQVAPDYIGNIIEGVCANAARRATKFLDGYRASLGTRPASVIQLSRALSCIAKACTDTPNVLQRIISSLVQTHGIAASSHPHLRGPIDALVRDGVLVLAKMELRHTSVRYVLAPSYIDTFIALKRSFSQAGNGQ